MITKMLALLCVLLALCTCSSPEEPEILLHIEGTVTDANNGTPIAGVFIELVEITKSSMPEISTKTNVDGRYVLYYKTKCLMCSYSLLAKKSLGRQKAKRIEVTSQIQIIDFQL